MFLISYAMFVVAIIAGLVAARFLKGNSKKALFAFSGLLGLATFLGTSSVLGMMETKPFQSSVLASSMFYSASLNLNVYCE